MPRETGVKDLDAAVAKLQQKRQELLDALAEIDSAFVKHGIKPPGRKRRARNGRRKKVGRPRKAKKRIGKKVAKRGRKKKKKAAKRGKRTKRRFKVSGPELIMNFVRRTGKNGVSGSEIVKHWQSKGRAGEAYTVIGKLVAAKKLKRQTVKGERGSRYSVA